MPNYKKNIIPKPTSKKNHSPLKVISNHLPSDSIQTLNKTSVASIGKTNALGGLIQAISLFTKNYNIKPSQPVPTKPAIKPAPTKPITKPVEKKATAPINSVSEGMGHLAETLKRFTYRGIM